MSELKSVEAIAKTVHETISQDFTSFRIINVHVDRDVDFDGDEILKIEIVFEGTPKDLDARKVSGAVRHVRPKLFALGEMAFPLLSFISQGDSRRVSFAPA